MQGFFSSDDFASQGTFGKVWGIWIVTAGWRLPLTSDGQRAGLLLAGLECARQPGKEAWWPCVSGAEL